MEGWLCFVFKKRSEAASVPEVVTNESLFLHNVKGAPYSYVAQTHLHNAITNVAQISPNMYLNNPNPCGSRGAIEPKGLLGA